MKKKDRKFLDADVTEPLCVAWEVSNYKHAIELSFKIADGNDTIYLSAYRDNNYGKKTNDYLLSSVNSLIKSLEEAREAFLAEVDAVVVEKEFDLKYGVSDIIDFGIPEPKAKKKKASVKASAKK
jgi:hypothetical protein